MSETGKALGNGKLGFHPDELHRLPNLRPGQYDAIAAVLEAPGGPVDRAIAAAMEAR